MFAGLGCNRLHVALRKESVDRNGKHAQGPLHRGPVALRKESVDRNYFPGPDLVRDSRSLSARRAWIEILDKGICNDGVRVALRKESVDRNIKREISLIRPYVALRKESVDRNAVP